MKWFAKKNGPPLPYPPDRFEPVLQCSVCTGEQTFCMRERETGRTHQLQLVRSPEELARVCRAYGVRAEDVRRVY